MLTHRDESTSALRVKLEYIYVDVAESFAMHLRRFYKAIVQIKRLLLCHFEQILPKLQLDFYRGLSLDKLGLLADEHEGKYRQEL